MTISPLYEHGGNIHAAANSDSIALEEILDFSANINPLGPPEWLRSCVSCELDNIVHYPDPTASALKKIIAQKYQLSIQNILVANGTTELLYQLPRVINPKRAIIPVPCYIDYLKVMDMAGVVIKTVELSEDKDFEIDINHLALLLAPGDMLILGTPNNPTGKCVDSCKLLDLACKNPDALFLIDEAFLEFVPGRESLAGKAPNIITLHSLTKFYAIPGLRLGFGIFPDVIAPKLQNIIPPWTVNSLAQKVGERAITDKEYQKRSIEICQKNRSIFKKDLSNFKDLKIQSSEANYFLIRLLGQHKVHEIKQKLARKNILIRDCLNYQGLGQDYFRIAIRSKKENKLFCAALSTILSVRLKRKTLKKTPSIMFQGTSSNAGKSVLTTALCRILLQDGVQVAPFKAQNMSLNSFVTMDGLEMGRAQVVQAQAARLDPDVLMNPILLKPNSDTGSQIIVRGKPLGNMSVMDYVSYKKEAMNIVSDCYDELASQYQAIILEGAGSPGEVNLKSHDIVNMRMARHADSPVILVGDIDRGGVYASFVGHMEVLNQWERRLIAGFLVNRFRGKQELLQDAHDYVKSHTGKEVIGVIPYLFNHGIPEEDSVSFKNGLFEGTKPDIDHVEIVVINLPHISNFTDFEAFINEPDVYLRIVSTPDELENPDVIIIPGSKNVIGDLCFMQATGMHEAIQKQAETGCEIVGICGGYMMLGTLIEDPHGIESNHKTVAGLSLIDVKTVLDQDKTLTRKDGIHVPSGQPVVGYEIHHGLTSSSEDALFTYDDGSSCGITASGRNTWGCYLHGIFDSDLFRRWFVDSVRRRKNYPDYTGALYNYNLEPAFDRLADTVREGMDMDKVYQLLGL